MILDPETGEFHENEPGQNRPVRHENMSEDSIGGVEPSAPVTMPPDEEAAMKFTKLLPFVSKLSAALPSKGGLVRVMHALAEFPLGASKPRLLNEAERQLFQVMMELQGYKSTVVTSIMKKNAEVQKEAEALKQPIVESNDGTQA